jgi:hypothetical protein
VITTAAAARQGPSQCSQSHKSGQLFLRADAP